MDTDKHGFMGWVMDNPCLSVSIRGSEMSRLKWEAAKLIKISGASVDVIIPATSTVIAHRELVVAHRQPVPPPST